MKPDTTKPSRRFAAFRSVAAGEAEAYAQDADRPLGSYLVLMGSYLSAVATMIAFVRRRRIPVPNSIYPGDLALVAVGTFRLSRLVTKDSVTAAVRAPFTRFTGAAGVGEVNEEVRGDGLRHAIGELVTCPFCMAQWTATLLVFGLVVAPRFTRLAASVLAAVTVSDALQLTYSKLSATA